MPNNIQHTFNTLPCELPQCLPRIPNLLSSKHLSPPSPSPSPHITVPSTLAPHTCNLPYRQSSLQHFSTNLNVFKFNNLTLITYLPPSTNTPPQPRNLNNTPHVGRLGLEVRGSLESMASWGGGGGEFVQRVVIVEEVRLVDIKVWFVSEG